MIQLLRHDDVTQLLCSTRTSRMLDYVVSAYLVRGVLVDTAFPAVGAELARWAAGSPPAGAFVTHHHEDHAGNVVRLAALGIPLAVAPDTLERLRAPKPIGLYRRTCWGSAPAFIRDVEPFSHPSLALLPARGHSPDHHVVWDAERGTMFGGDLFIGVKVRIAHPGEDIRGQVLALRAMAALQPVRFFDAHRGALTRPVEQLLAKAAWTEEMIGAIEQLVGAGWNDRAIRNQVLGREDLTGWLSAGDYSRLNFVRSVRASIPDSTSAGAPSTMSRPTGHP